MLSKAQIERFGADGFLIVADVFTPAEIEGFRSAVDIAVERRGTKPPPMAERDAYDRMFTQYFNLWEDAPEVRPFTFEPKVARIASMLLHGARLRIYCDQAFYKEPGSSETGAHQDYPLLSIAETATVNAWIPLAGCTLEGGALGYLKGSHRFGAVSRTAFALGGDPRLNDAFEPPAYYALTPGSVAFHHVLTFHLSLPNRSALTRKAFAITYVADGSTRGSHWPHASVDRAGIAVGEKIEGPATPIVWPPPSEAVRVPPPLANAPRGWPGHRDA